MRTTLLHDLRCSWNIVWRWQVILLLTIFITIFIPISLAHARQQTARTADSLPALSMARIEAVVKAKWSIERITQAHPDVRLPGLRVPGDPLALERALNSDPRLVAALKEAGLSAHVYAQELTRVTTAVLGVAVFEELDRRTTALIGRHSPALGSDWRKVVPRNLWTDTFHLALQIAPAELWVQNRDVVFVREHQSALAAAGFSVSGLGLTDQLQGATAWPFPVPAGRTRTAASDLYGRGTFLDSVEASAAARTEPPLRVLFLGEAGSGKSDRRYVHNESFRLFRLLAGASLGRRVVVGQFDAMVSEEGVKSPEGFFLRSVIRHLPWDYVVLQQHVSVSGYGVWPGASSEAITGTLSLYDSLIRARSARSVYTVFGNDSLHRKVVTRMTTATRAVGVQVAPMWTAWKAVQAAAPGMVMLGAESDFWGSGHLGPHGHYLQALVFYRTLTGKSPIGLPAPPVEVGPDSTFTISPENVAILQRAAAAAFSGSTP